MMLEYLSDKHDLPAAGEAALRIENAVDKAYETIKPMEFGGRDGTVSISKAVLAAL